MPTLSDWAWIVTMAMQAMLGEVSCNVRMIALAYEDGAWRLDFYLERDDPADRESAEEIADGLTTYLGDIRDRVSPAAYAPVNLTFAVDSGRLATGQTEQRRLIFRRREAAS